MTDSGSHALRGPTSVEVELLALTPGRTLDRCLDLRGPISVEVNS
jgi:hypothetical protein